MVKPSSPKLAIKGLGLSMFGIRGWGLHVLNPKPLNPKPLNPNPNPAAAPRTNAADAQPDTSAHLSTNMPCTDIDIGV